MIVIKSKKTGRVSEITKKGWIALQRQGYGNNFEVTQSGKAEAPPEVTEELEAEAPKPATKKAKK